MSSLFSLDFFKYIEAEIVKIIFEQFINTDMGGDAIAEYLNQHGYSKKRTRSREISYFTRSTIMKILDNPVYVGKIAYGKNVTEKVKGTRDQYRRVKADDYLLADGIHEAIIDQETWELAKRKRKITGVKWNKTHSLEHEHILSGIVKCPICGTGLAGTVRRRKNKKTGEYKDDFYYRCLHRNRIDDEHKCNYKPSLNQDALNAEVEAVIFDMIADQEFKDFITSKLDERVDVKTLEEERDAVRVQLRQALAAKNKLTSLLDQLNYEDRHYERKYQDMHDRLDNLYDKIAGLEETIENIEAQISKAYQENISSKEIYKILSKFDKLYDKMSDLEKKEFMQGFIESIELFPERLENGRIIKAITFVFSVFYDGHEGKEIRLLNENTVEVVCCLHRVNI